MCVPRVVSAPGDEEQWRCLYARWPLLEVRAGDRPRPCVQDPGFGRGCATGPVRVGTESLGEEGVRGPVGLGPEPCRTESRGSSQSVGPTRFPSMPEMVFSPLHATLPLSCSPGWAWAQMQGPDPVGGLGAPCPQRVCG